MECAGARMALESWEVSASNAPQASSSEITSVLVVPTKPPSTQQPYSASVIMAFPSIRLAFAQVTAQLITKFSTRQLIDACVLRV